jgi:SET domain-containing protein
MSTYRPLPTCVTIQPSEIEGLGLFATEAIPKGTSLGISHVVQPGYEDDLLRTPLGGFFNHSATPNCTTLSFLNTSLGECLYLVTTRDLTAGEELTVTYTLYDPTGAK